MKQFCTVVVCFILVMASQFIAVGQSKDDKEEEKKWKKKLKEVEPLEYKTLYEEYNSLKGESNSLKRQVQALEKEIESSRGQLSSKDSEIASMQEKIAGVKDECEASAPQQMSSEDYTKGIVYRVQVGAFRNPKLNDFMQKGSIFEIDSDGKKKYTIGNYRDFKLAESFKSYLLSIGVKDAWIVAYEDNVRKDIKDKSGKN